LRVVKTALSSRQRDHSDFQPADNERL